MSNLEYYIGELVKTPKNVLGVSIDESGKRRSIRLKADKVFLVLAVISEEDMPLTSQVTIWRDGKFLKVWPLSHDSYDDFLMGSSSPVQAIYVALETVQFLST